MEARLVPALKVPEIIGKFQLGRRNGKNEPETRNMLFSGSTNRSVLLRRVNRCRCRAAAELGARASRRQIFSLGNYNLPKYIGSRTCRKKSSPRRDECSTPYKSMLYYIMQLVLRSRCFAR
jgi:hypothetical protein